MLDFGARGSKEQIRQLSGMRGLMAKPQKALYQYVRSQGGAGCMKYEVKFTNQFKKDLKLAKKQNRDLDRLFDAINILADGGTLDAKYRDHDLTGNYKGTRECHIEPDWLLVYEIWNDVLVLMLYRLGTHSELFRK